MTTRYDDAIFETDCLTLLEHLGKDTGDGQRMNCPWSDDSDSNSFVVDGPLWRYYAGSADDELSGNVFQLACKFTDSNRQAIDLLYAAGGKTAPEPSPLAKPATLTNSTKPKSVIDKAYDYVDAVGQLVLQAVRWIPKKFSYRRPDGNGAWIWNLKGIAEKPLYNLPAVIKADTVFVTEGEKDVDRLGSIGLVGTTNACGATHWQESYSKFLKDKKVIILPDNDEQGRKHAQTVTNSTLPHAKEIRIVELPNLPEKGDVSDWLDTGRTKDELLKLADAAAVITKPFTAVATPTNRKKGSIPRLKSVPANVLCEMEFPDLQWMVQDLIPEGLVVFFGKEKIGKSFAVLDLAMEIANGGTAFGKIPVEKRGVLYLALEDSQKRLKSRMLQLGGNGANAIPPNLHLVACTPDVLSIKSGLIEQLEQELKDHPDVQLLVIDTLQKIFGTGSRGQDAYQSAYEIMSKLHTFTTQQQLCMIVIHHEKKGDSGDAFERASGSRGLGAVADAQMRIERPRFQGEDAILSITGRDVEEMQYSMRWDSDTGKWALLGEAADLCKTKERQQILEALMELGGEATPSVIQGALAEQGAKKSPQSINYLLARMVKDGEIQKASKGVYSLFTPQLAALEGCVPTYTTTTTTPAPFMDDDLFNDDSDDELIFEPDYDGDDKELGRPLVKPVAIKDKDDDSWMDRFDYGAGDSGETGR